MLNEPHNAETSGAISTDASRATVRVIRTDEELMIAPSVWRSGTSLPDLWCAGEPMLLLNA
jgi:acetate kinase